MERPDFDPRDEAAQALDQIEIHVQSRLGHRLSQFRLVVHDHGLVLRGRARTWYAKQLVQHAVMEATALPILANEIEVL
ncbi:MAG TPA: hypothetical protein VFA26_00810 [Gemmataceae bacterium]|nr:hypothetical protein [Gemmataceae bacterium]